MLRKIFLRPKKGFTLVELLIVILINAVLFTGLISIYIANMVHYRKTLNSNRLNQQMQIAMTIISNDIRRAGYWANAQSDIGYGHSNDNPFMVSGNTDISVNNSNNCILLSYDHNSDGSLPTINTGTDDERYGYRLSGQAIQSRPVSAAFSCTAGASTWENITDINAIQITNLTFTLTTYTLTTGPGTHGITLRSVDISMTGQLASDSTVTKTLTEHIRVRNGKFIP